MDAGFHGKSTPHHSNTPPYHAQGHWPRPPNLLQQLFSFIPFFHNCLTYIQISVNYSQPHFTHRIQRANKTCITHKPSHTYVCNTSTCRIPCTTTVQQHKATSAKTAHAPRQRQPPQTQIHKRFHRIVACQVQRRWQLKRWSQQILTVVIPNVPRR